jgi:prepilin-type N-terminal cleavage/methylation domain-containing protein
MLKHRSSQMKRGFTLIELLVVIAIIGILSSVVLASLNDARQKSRDAKRVADVKQMVVALEMYFDRNGVYPTALGDLAPDYIAAVPTDPVGGGAYAYSALGIATDCSSYHIGANLESSTHVTLGADVDATADAECDGSAVDFDGTDVADTDCAGTAASGRTCYDVKP